MSEYLDMHTIEDPMKDADFFGKSPLSQGLWADIEEVQPIAIIDDSVFDQITI